MGGLREIIDPELSEHEADHCQVFIVRFASVPDRLFGWLPLYPVLRTVVFGTFFATRIAVSWSPNNASVKLTPPVIGCYIRLNPSAHLFPI